MTNLDGANSQTDRGRVDKIKDDALTQLTTDVSRLVSNSPMSQREISKKLGTSETQISRLLKPSFKSKTFDQLVRVAAALGYQIRFVFEKASSNECNVRSVEQKFPLLNSSDFANQKTNFEGFN